MSLGTIHGLQERKFWIRPTRTAGLVDVDPVVGEQVLVLDHQRDGEEVAVAQAPRGVADIDRRLGLGDANGRGVAAAMR